MSSKRNRPREARGRSPVRRLAHELFSELNATYYEDDPAKHGLTIVQTVESSQMAVTPPSGGQIR